MTLEEDIYLVQRLHSGWCNISPFCLLKRMPTKNLLHYLRWVFRCYLQKIYQCVAIRSIQSISIFSAWYCDLSNFLTQLDSRFIINFYHFVNASQSRLSLACYEMRSNPKTINFVALENIHFFLIIHFLHSRFINFYLLVQTYYSLFVDVVGRANHQFCKPWYVVLDGNFLENISRHVTKIR